MSFVLGGPALVAQEVQCTQLRHQQRAPQSGNSSGRFREMYPKTIHVGRASWQILVMIMAVAV